MPAHVIGKLLEDRSLRDWSFAVGVTYAILPGGGLVFDFSRRKQARGDLIKALVDSPDQRKRADDQVAQAVEDLRRGVPEEELKWHCSPTFSTFRRLPIPGCRQTLIDSAGRTSEFPGPDTLVHLADLEEECFVNVVVAQDDVFGIEYWNGLSLGMVHDEMRQDAVNIWVRSRGSLTKVLLGEIERLLSEWWRSFGGDEETTLAVSKRPLYAEARDVVSYKGEAAEPARRKDSLLRELISTRSPNKSLKLAWELERVKKDLTELVSRRQDLVEKRRTFSGKSWGAHCQADFSSCGPAVYWDLVARIVTFSETVEPLQFVMFS